MRFCVNLAPSVHLSKSFNQHRRAAYYTALIYISFFLFLLNIPRLWSSETLLECWSSAPFFAELRTDLKSINTTDQVAELKNNFLFNERISDPLLRETFQSAGLSHLLAISGGQTGPAAVFFCTTTAIFILIVMKIIYPSPRFASIQCSRYVILASGLIAVFFLVGLFQSTGALTRVLATQLTALILFFAFRQSHLRQSKNLILLPLLKDVAPWLIALYISINPTDDLSFLLSALGASSAQFVSEMVGRISKSKQRTQALKQLPENLFENLCNWILTTSLTSALMCIFCLPLWPASGIAEKILANLLAGPLVLIVITPATIAIIIFQACQFELLRDYTVHILVFGLTTFRTIAEIFGEQLTQPNFIPTARFVRPGVTYAWYNHPYLFLITLNFSMMFGIFMLKKNRTESLALNEDHARG